MEKRCECTDKQRESCSHEEFECVFCPCDDFSVSKPSIQCPICFIWYHFECMGLKGLIKEDADRMVNWKCYVCWSSSSPMCPNKKDIDSGSIDLRTMIQEELEKAIPLITNSVTSEVVRQTEEKTNKKWSEVVKSNQDTKTAIETTITENQKKVVADVITKQDADMVERDRRSKNIVIKGVPESTATNDKEKQAHDWEKVLDIFDIVHIEEESCYRLVRAGPKLGTGYNKNRTEPRPLIATLESPQLAADLHRHGFGRRLMVEFGTSEHEKECWINPDLIKSDRDAAFDARKLRNALAEKKKLRNPTGSTAPDDTPFQTSTES